MFALVEPLKLLWESQRWMEKLCSCLCAL